METIHLNYSYRFPRVLFRSGETKYGILYSYYNKVKKRLEHYFADASLLRKYHFKDTAIALERIRKQADCRVNPQEILKVEYMN